MVSRLCPGQLLLLLYSRRSRLEVLVKGTQELLPGKSLFAIPGKPADPTGDSSEGGLRKYLTNCLPEP